MKLYRYFSIILLFTLLSPAVNLFAQQDYVPELYMAEVKGGNYVTGTKISVVILDFNISIAEVDQKLWTEVMGYNPSNPVGDDLPVNNIQWLSAVEFCNKLSTIMGYPLVYTIEENGDVFADMTVKGIRLPTEEEWEYAAKGGNQSQGFKYAGSNNPDEVAWYFNNSSKKIHPVGSKMPNELGLFDMSGNVAEWTFDTDAKNSNNRILKGGTWNSKVSLLTPNSRTSVSVESVPDERVGLRVAVSMDR